MPAQDRNRPVFSTTFACLIFLGALAEPAHARPAHAADAASAAATTAANTAGGAAAAAAEKESALPRSAQRPQPGGVAEIVVVGRRLRGAPLALESAAVTVIGREEIEQSGAVDLLDVLRGALGAAPNRSGGPGQQSSLFVRGGNGERVQVIVDGVRVKDDISGSADWGQLAAENIERVELLRGAQSTLFGADAAGGVVQIFTRAGQRRAGRALSARLQLPGFGNSERGASALLSGEAPLGIEYNAGVSHRAGKEVSAFRKRNGALLRRGESERDAARNTQLQGNIAVEAHGFRSALNARHAWIEADYDGYDSSCSCTNPDDARTRHETRETQLSWQLDLPRLGPVESRATLAERRRRRTDFPASDRSVSRSRQASLVGEANLGAMGFGALRFLAGADFEALREELRNFTRLDARTSRAGAFARADWQFGKLGADAGLRYENHSDAGSAVTWQLGGRYELLAGLDLVASGGSAFRAPSPYQLFNASSGNLGLSPERSRGFDLGLRFLFEPGPGLELRGEVRGFQQHYRDMIDFVFVPPATSSYFNVNRSRYRGVEMEAHLRTGPVRLEAAHTRIQSYVARGTTHALRRPDTARLALGVAQDAFSGEAVLHYTGARRGIDGLTFRNIRLEAHTLLDLNLKFRLGKRAGLRAHLHNATGRDYQEIGGYGTLGRTLRVFLDLQM